MRGKTPRGRAPGQAATGPAGEAAAELQVRPVRSGDLPDVIALDATVTGLHKADYWQRVYRRYGVGGQGLRHFLVAVAGGRVVGFMIGDQKGIGTQLLAAMRERFERVGVRMLRTMLASDNQLILSFFRSQGLRAGRLIPLELEIGTPA